MAGRRLTPEEAALWAKVRASVRPIDPRRADPARIENERLASAPPGSTTEPVTLVTKRVRGRVPAPRVPPAPPRPAAAATLDGGWDRRLLRGVVAPDRTIDLHGYTLSEAHAALDRGIDAALAAGDRVILLITGKPPRSGSPRPHARGAIRAQIADWLALSRHASRIAAVRGAHPRHGGTGALYIVLRRPR